MLNKNTDSPPAEKSLYGIVYMISMTVCFAFLDAAAKHLSRELPLLMVVWGRYVFHFLLVTLFFFRRASGNILQTKKIKLQMLRSILIFCAGVTFWGALKFMPLADCFVIAFTSPLLVTALSVLILGENVSTHRWGVVIVGLLGVLLVMRPGIGMFNWVSTLPLITALFYASLQITTRILGQSDNALTTLFYSGAGGLILSSIAVFFVWVPPSLEQWLVFVLLGFLGTTGHYFMIKAFEFAPVSLLAPFDYTTLIWATILGFVLFGDLPDTWTISGAIIITSSGLYLMMHERRFVTA